MQKIYPPFLKGQMALPFHALNKLHPYLYDAKILSLGYPDLMVSAEEIEKLFGYKPTRFTEAAKWHGLKNPCPETLELFERLGSELTVVDFTQESGVEKIADLNYPHDFGKFDLVIDSGTLEHCFNIGQAMLNAVNSVKVGGAIFHLSPLDVLNHGFYNMNPTLFNDFYLQNEWDIKEVKIMPSSSPVIHTTNRFTMYTEHIIRVLVERPHDKPIKYPIQTKYLQKMAVRDEIHLQNGTVPTL